MDYLGSYANTGSGSGNNMYIFAIIGVVLALIIWGVASFFWNRSKTMPSVQGFQDAQQVDISGTPVPTEGFFGGVAVGAGEPNCLRTSSEAAQVYAIFANRASSTEEGPADFQEFRLLLSKLACFKKDLIGTAGVVEATRYQAYATSMDIEPIGETTARCFAKTIPSRDLEISLEKWGKRGKELIRRLCTSMNITEMESAQADTLFDALLRDVSDVARSVCLSGEPTINGKNPPRQPNGFEPESLSELGPYKGYY
jgi:hypothetical protein